MVTRLAARRQKRLAEMQDCVARIKRNQTPAHRITNHSSNRSVKEDRNISFSSKRTMGGVNGGKLASNVLATLGHTNSGAEKSDEDAGDAVDDRVLESLSKRNSKSRSIESIETKVIGTRSRAAEVEDLQANRSAANANANKSNGLNMASSEVLPHNRQPKGNVKSLLHQDRVYDVDSWEGLDNSEEKGKRNEFLHQMGPMKGRSLDEYDREYDRGKVKKVRQNANNDSILDSHLFDQVGRAQREGKMKPTVQFRGKKRRQERFNKDRKPALRRSKR